jgi:5'(3')-deoxyribonucleotidase
VRIILDMDDVLCDFVGGACTAHGISKEFYYNVHHRPGKFYMHVGMGISYEEYKAPIDQMGQSFWKMLQPTPWMAEVIDLVEQTTPDWFIASTPMETRGCAEGKIEWCRRFLGSEFDRLILIKQKHLLINHPSHILIDDKESTVDYIHKQKLGHAVLFPTRHNCRRLRGLYKDPVRYVRKRLKEVIHGDKDP